MHKNKLKLNRVIIIIHIYINNIINFNFFIIINNIIIYDIIIMIMITTIIVLIIIILEFDIGCGYKVHCIVKAPAALGQRPLKQKADMKQTCHGASQQKCATSFGFRFRSSITKWGCLRCVPNAACSSSSYFFFLLLWLLLL